ncbi:MAG: branched-chain amino acid transaminase [Candidatus Eisenbacteria bacterium]|uniref:Branched-chain-amino-acid aminotransferase n=1 Tax=Eiseniibacteriota bacterium TaxID=2212470 RepID=A0A849SB51_UNCEI|nr:branched-chain amino acid transaminase [Candidatus Eisenbacteria bacterium]
MAIQKVEKIWMSGKWVAWDDARIHVLSHVAHYASSVFEGIRAYQNPSGVAIFRLDEHLDRLLASAKIYRMELPFERAVLHQTCLDVVAINDLRDCYLRPLVYRGYENLGVNPFGSPVEVAIAAFPWSGYLGEDALAKGVAVKVSSWWRIAPNTLPAMAKASANYMNSQLIKMEALTDGYSEGIALDTQGFVSEGSGQNVFLVAGGELITPPLTSSVLAGITRQTVVTLARELGIPVRESVIPREMLYLADELFFSGTAVEISPITSVDRITVGSGARGPVTKRLQEAYFGILRGELPDRHGWLTAVPAAAAARAR